MRKAITVLLVSSTLLAGCGVAQRLNPFNWFGNARTQQVEAQQGQNPLIPRANARTRREITYDGTLIQSVQTLKMERIPGGGILRVSGVSARQGAHEARLVKLDTPDSPNTLTYELRALQFYDAPVGGQRSRTLTAATRMSDRDLAGIRQIRVVGASNVMSVRR